MPRYSSPSVVTATFNQMRNAVKSGVIKYLPKRTFFRAMKNCDKALRTRSHYRTSLAGHLRRAGYVELGKLLTRSECSEIQFYLSKHDLVDTRETGSLINFDKLPDNDSTEEYPFHIVVNCPHVLRLANQREIINLVASYLGYTPTIAHIGLRWSVPRNNSEDEVQSFRREADLDIIELIIYLTDVDNTSGPYAYVTGTHRKGILWSPRSYSTEDISRCYGGAQLIHGSAGTAFIIDSKGIHRRAAPTQRPRLLLVIHYSPVYHPLSKYFRDYVEQD